MRAVAIHVVDDEPSVRVALERLLSASGFAVHSYGSAEEFLVSAGDHGCAVLDIDLPGMSGIELQRELQARGHCWQIVFLSAHRDIIARAKASVLNDGAVAVLEKPARAVDLLDAINRALKRLGVNRTPHGGPTSGEQPPSV